MHLDIIFRRQGCLDEHVCISANVLLHLQISFIFISYIFFIRLRWCPPAFTLWVIDLVLWT